MEVPVLTPRLRNWPLAPTHTPSGLSPRLAQSAASQPMSSFLDVTDCETAKLECEDRLRG